MINQGFQGAWSGPHGFSGVRQSAYSGAQQIPPVYVNPGHAAATDVGNDGQDPRVPLATITRAIALAVEHMTIIVQDDVAEVVVIPNTAPPNCSIVAGGGTPYQVAWAPGAGAATALTIRQAGWLIEGFLFNNSALGTSICIEWVSATGIVGNRTTIRGNRFDGLWQGLYGIQLFGAPFDTTIIGNEFREQRSGANTAYAICVTDSSDANPYMCTILNNLFWENDNHIGSLGNDKSFNLSVFKNNVFHDGVLIPAALLLDLRGGSQGENIVVDNYFSGDYSNTGGYYANAANPGNWVGNYAEDVAEAEVGDNGITVAVPAA